MEVKRRDHLYEDGEYDDDEDGRLEQVLVWNSFNVEQRNQTECDRSTQSTIRLIHDTTNTTTHYRPTASLLHTHPFNGPLSGTTRVSQYQKGKTDLDFTEARDSEWQ